MISLPLREIRKSVFLARGKGMVMMIMRRRRMMMVGVWEVETDPSFVQIWKRWRTGMEREKGVRLRRYGTSERGWKEK